MKEILVALVAVGVAAGAQAQVVLTGGRTARFVDAADPRGDRAQAKFSRDAALTPALSPLCPAVTRLRILTSNGDTGLISLPCQNWRATGSGFRYTDRTGTAGGVRSITYRGGSLSLKLQGPPYRGIPGPLAWADVQFAVDTAQFCGGFTAFSKNEPGAVTATKPSGGCTCGNHVVDVGEGCDDGDLVDGDGCDSNCRATGCGNGIVTAGEACDDGNTTSGDGCDANCTATACGNGIVTPGEGCDDGNTAAGDCCTPACVPVADGTPCTDDSRCTAGDACVAGTCAATPITPWINELDYDDYFLAGNQDSDEFVEIAAPAGTDLGGYRLLAVEGNPSCNTPFGGATAGNAHFTAILPPGTVVPDDTGTGIGFVVACLTGTSGNHVLAGECDVVLPAPYADSNLQNGNLLNADGWSCPDGVLLLDPAGTFVDAVSYEGQVPNVGAFGAFFHLTPYSAGLDEGFKTGVSYEKTSSALGRAVAATEWALSGGCVNAGIFDFFCVERSDSPGAVNPGQQLSCLEAFCGSGSVDPGEDCDAGVANADTPNAACRTDCTYRRCGDGIVDPAFAEQCEADAQCGGGQSCFACECVSGAPLGPLDFTILPSSPSAADDGQVTLLRVTPPPGLPIDNGSQGNWNVGPLRLAAGPPDANGVAALLLTEPVILGATLPALAGTGRVCVRVRQDPDAIGRIDCDGGSNFDATITIDSQGAGAALPPVFTAGAGGDDSGPGAAIVRVLVQGATTTDATTTCEDADYSASPVTRTGFTTATAVATVQNALQGGLLTATLTGQPFTCANWTTDGGASLAAPNVNLDVPLSVLGILDVGQVLRLNDD